MAVIYGPRMSIVTVVLVPDVLGPLIIGVNDVPRFGLISKSDRPPLAALKVHLNISLWNCSVKLPAIEGTELEEAAFYKYMYT